MPKVIALEHAAGRGTLEVFVRGKKQISREGTNEVDGDLVGWILKAINRRLKNHVDVILIFVDESVYRGDYDLFVKSLRGGGRPKLPKGFIDCCDPRLVDYETIEEEE